MPAVVVQADQSGDGYAKSDHIAVAEEQLHYNGGIPTLAFTHCTARISLTLSGSTSDVSSVRLTNLSTADGNPGEIIAHDAGSGTIYEALVARKAWLRARHSSPSPPLAARPTSTGCKGTPNGMQARSTPTTSPFQLHNDKN